MVNEQLCPEYFQKGPRNFVCFFCVGSLCLAVAASSFFLRFSVFKNFVRPDFFRILICLSFFYFKAKNFVPRG